MAVNRFFNAERGVYQSMFVPQELPQDLMLGVLGQKQKGYNEQEANRIILGEWNQRALEGYDTEFIKQKKKEIESFIGESQGKDLTSPDYIREYQSFVKKFKEDEGIKKVAGAVAKDDAFWKRIEELKKDKDTSAYADVLANEYLTRRKYYTKDTKQGGLGFTGDIALGDENVLTGVDLIKESKQIFDDIKQSGSEASHLLSDGIYYKTGYKGVGDKTIQNRVYQMVDTFAKSRAGEQLTAEYNRNLFGEEVPSIQLSKLTPDQQSKYEEGRKKYISDFLTRAGGEFVHGETTTNIAEALNKKGDREWEVQKEAVQQPVLELSGGNIASLRPKYEATVGENGTYQNHIKAIDGSQEKIDIYSKLQESIKSGKMINLTPQEKAKIIGIPGAEELMQGKPIPENKKELLLKTISDYSETELMKMNASKREVKDIESHLLDAVSTVITKDYNGKNIKEVYTQYDALDKDPLLKPFRDRYNQLLDEGKPTAIDFIDKNLNALRENIKQGKVKDAAAGKKLLEGLMLMKDFGRAKKDHDEIAFANEKDLEGKNTPYGIDYVARLEKNKDLAAKKNKIIEYYNTYNTTVPKATVAVKEPYMKYAIDANGNRVIKGKVGSVDKQVENDVRLNPTGYTIVDLETGQPLQPTMIDENGNTVPNPAYPKGEFLTMESVDNDIINTWNKDENMGSQPTFNFTAKIPNIKATTLEDENGKPKTITVKGVTEKRYKVIANGMTAKSYNTAKAEYYYSNFLADEGYNPANPTDFSKITPTGLMSFTKHQQFKNPELGTSLAKVNALTSKGQETNMPFVMYNTKTQNQDQYEIKVKKVDDNHLLAEITDKKGNLVMSEKRFANVVDYSNFLDLLKEGAEAEVIAKKQSGIGPDLEEVRKEMGITKDKTLTDIKDVSSEDLFKYMKFPANRKP